MDCSLHKARHLVRCAVLVAVLQRRANLDPLGKGIRGAMLSAYFYLSLSAGEWYSTLLGDWLVEGGGDSQRQQVPLQQGEGVVNRSTQPPHRGGAGGGRGGGGREPRKGRRRC
eukprot:372498-Pyramimonas_sp.AAC.1